MREKRRRVPSNDDESLWIEALQAGEPVAFRRLIERYQSSVYQVCLKMMNHNTGEAEDMAQETLIRVSQAIGQFRGDAKLSTWVYRIAINLCKNRIAYLARRAEYKHDALPQLQESGGDSWERRARLSG